MKLPHCTNKHCTDGMIYHRFSSDGKDGAIITEKPCPTCNPDFYSECPKCTGALKSYYADEIHCLHCGKVLAVKPFHEMPIPKRVNNERRIKGAMQDTICRGCGRHYQAQNRNGHIKQFCSKGCYDKHYLDYGAAYREKEREAT